MRTKQLLRVGYRGAKTFSFLTENKSIYHRHNKRPGHPTEGYVAVRASEDPIIRYMLLGPFSIQVHVVRGGNIYINIPYIHGRCKPGGEYTPA